MHPDIKGIQSEVLQGASGSKLTAWLQNLTPTWSFKKLFWYKYLKGSVDVRSSYTTHNNNILVSINNEQKTINVNDMYDIKHEIWNMKTANSMSDSIYRHLACDWWPELMASSDWSAWSPPPSPLSSLGPVRAHGTNPDDWLSRVSLQMHLQSAAVKTGTGAAVEQVADCSDSGEPSWAACRVCRPIWGLCSVYLSDRPTTRTQS